MIKQTYFLGGTSPSGFYSRFIEQIKEKGYYTYILKGGPGTGKSTLMKKAAEALNDDDLSVYYCSSDLNSLDAVVDEDKKLIIVDGTAPHVFEALYPGVSQEVINLGEFWDEKKLKKQHDQVHRLFDENLKYHTRVGCYVKALAALNSDIYAIGEDSLDKNKIDGYILRLCKKIIENKKENSDGKLRFRQLSAFTTENYKTMPLEGYYSIYQLNDDSLAGSDYFLKAVSEILLANGYDVVVSQCLLHNKTVYEQVISESAGLAFVTSHFFNNIDYPSAAVINFGRFYSKESVSAKKNRLSFDRKAFRELAAEAADTLSKALEIHDDLEKNYIDAIDFKKLNEFTERFIDKIRG